MPYIERPEELADALADLIGVYGAHDPFNAGEECPDDPRKMCRVCFTTTMTARIRRSVSNEEMLVPHHENCDTRDLMIKGKPCNCRGR